jgi:hypothetical protein
LPFIGEAERTNRQAVQSPRSKSLSAIRRGGDYNAMALSPTEQRNDGQMPTSLADATQVQTIRNCTEPQFILHSSCTGKLCRFLLSNINILQNYDHQFSMTVMSILRTTL